MKILILIILLYVQSVYAAVEVKEFDAQSIKRLHVENTSGSVHVIGTGTAKARVASDKIHFDESCVLQVQQIGSAIVIKVDQQPSFRKATCEVNFDIQVPKAVALDLNNGAGTIDVQNTNGPIKYSLGSGDLTINSRVESLDGNSGSGNVSVKGLTGDAHVKSGSGKIGLTYTASSPVGVLDIKSGSGNAEVYLPPTTKVTASVLTGSGKVLNEFGESTGASFKVSFKAGSGDLSIRKLR